MRGWLGGHHRLRALFQYLATIGFAIVGNRVLTQVRGDLFRHLQGLSLGFHTRSKAGDLTMRLIGDVAMLKETAVTAALPLAANVLVLLGMVAVMMVLDWQLALIALIPLPVLWFASIRAGKKIQAASRKQRKVEGQMAATAAEAMSSMRTVQALSIEDRAADTFSGANGTSMAGDVRAKRIAAGLERLVDLLVACAIALVLYFGTLQVLRGRLTPGDLLVFITYLKATFRPIRGYAKYASRLAKASAAGERVVQLLDEVPRSATAPVPWPPRLCRADHVRRPDLRLWRGRPTLDGLTLDIPAGTNVALTGPSGAGKSTLAGLLLRLYDPSGGRILIDGQDIRDVTMTSLRRQIGFVPQETVLFSGTLADNIALGAGRNVTGTRSRPQPAWPTRMTSSRPCPTAMTPRSRNAAPRCRQVSASASPSPAPPCAAVRCWSWTSPRPAWTAATRPPCPRRSGAWPRAAPAC
ncbi:ABC transporter ATP-binding protein [Paracoccus marcusii]|nr:ABC transporter ATP-binding protein [Paracoccus marcusii]